MLRRLLKPDRAVSEITGGDVVELGVLQSERHIYCMTQRTSTERETKAMQFLCFTKALLKIIIPTHCNNLNELNDRKIFLNFLPPRPNPTLLQSLMLAYQFRSFRTLCLYRVAYLEPHFCFLQKHDHALPIILPLAYLHLTICPPHLSKVIWINV